ncbi:hypothetical protein C8F04DRAFT_1059605 [Mycena alexandri]|uniref:Uncharacterized protein n=1 Tax=Mycena alexandri TaxID=1745969 RepID=A0AAD6TJS2_9AGAR|nr:hypothetical protein C8F04DRAFT_1059605 [Mycena alexandri]
MANTTSRVKSSISGSYHQPTTMPLGEVPITSYFNRVPQKKRKQNSASAPTKAPKRKRVDSDEVDEVKAPKKQVSLAFPKAARKAARVAPASPQHPDSNVDLESRVHHPTLNPSEISLPTTPNTRRPLSPLLDTPALPVASEGFPQLPSSSIRSPSSPLVTPPRPRRKSDAAKGKSVAFASSPLLSFRNVNAPEHHCTPGSAPDDDDLPPSSVVPSPNLPRSSLGDGLDDDVPSSQSQYLFPFQLSPRRQNDPPDIDFVPSSQSQYWPPTAPEPIQRDDDGFVVPSSQSQWLLPLHLNATPNVPADVADAEVPSSQSQFEVELKPRNGFPSPTRRASGSASSYLVQSASHRPSSSDLAVDIADMFEEGSIDPAKVKSLKDQDDSATESDDDIPVILPRPSAPLPPPPVSQHDGYSLPPGGFSSYIDESMADEGGGSSSGSSVPEAVKDFYNMLDDGDGSYPASFPESLRGQWACGTPDGTPED